MGKNTHRIEAGRPADYEDEKHVDEDVSKMKDEATCPKKEAGFDKIEQPAFEAYVLTKVSQKERKAAKKAKMVAAAAPKEDK